MNQIIRGISYHIEIKGQGEPLLLLHGFTSSLNTWRFLGTELKGCRLIMIDIIGHGKTDSPADPQRYSMEETARDLAALLDQLNLNRVHILGYSMGGRIALSFACFFPMRVQSLILESASPGLRTTGERATRRIHDRELAKTIKKKGILAFVNFWENIPLFDTQRKLPQVIRDNVRKGRLCNNEEGLSSSLLGMGTGSQPSWWEHLHSLPYPVLLITGQLDPKFCRIAREMKNLLRNAEFKTVPGAGHNIHLEKSGLFSEIVRKFVTEKS